MDYNTAILVCMVDLHKYKILITACITLCCCTRNEVIEETHENGRPKKVRVFSRLLFTGRDRAMQYIEYHYNHNLKFRVGLKGGKFHGSSSSWFLNGKLKSKGTYRQGRREGKWKFFYETDGSLLSRGAYLSGEKEDLWEELWPNGEKRSWGEYSKGKKTGAWITQDSTGRLQNTNSCFEMNDTGSFVSYYRNGSIYKKYTCRKGKNTGAYRVTSPLGMLLEDGNYNQQHQKNGIWRTWHQNGNQASHRYYADGLLHGTSRTLDSLGNMIAQGEFNHGTGVLKKYHPDGMLEASESYIKGIRHGDHFTYYPSGSVNTRTVYARDKPLTYVRWHNSIDVQEARTAVTGIFKQGERDSVWDWYSPEGVLVESAAYSEGKRNGITRYYDAKTGKLQRTQMFEDGKETRAVLAPR
jgi:antitoxin component YwqK of YwqJK toxin-antitoxin module